MTLTTSVTARPPVTLPPMPGERDAARIYPPCEMERARMIEGTLTFDREGGFGRALAQGFFLVRIPEGVDVAPGDRFATHFHEARRGDELDRYRGFRDVDVPGDYQGYFDRPHDQWENFYIEMNNWAGVLPDDVARLGHQMTDLGISILRAILGYLELPEEDWAKVTSGLCDKRGHQMLAFNHFRADKPMRGTKFHRDSGWVTIVRSVEPGLLGLVDGALHTINPAPGYFIVNFGSSIEVLTERLPQPVRANVHGVARTERAPGQPDRMSYVVFLDSDLAGSIYQYDGGAPRVVQSVAEFAVQEVNRTYDGDDLHL
ncbi:MAG: 2OG-Fe(II) oxygenase family protein [Kofleriaceae bacterium]